MPKIILVSLLFYCEFYIISRYVFTNVQNGVKLKALTKQGGANYELSKIYRSYIIKT
ncbi:hypothetical protein LSA01_10680 [Latilactobacillus sakei]|nr:ABC-type dipeptide/oligopeptide/nickel transport system permease component [Latilactobacillus sakei subsp. sakei DSM 20017 = JCM 1157]GEA76989.1 hypothetical protein LSA01_10680 [Latilactobacillus sakei]GEL36654.1 hypothetical protein LSA02_13890 [Latilactobacillus sakei subsp. sakei]